MTSAAISANGLNVNAHYTITGGDLPAAGTIDFYWATGPNISNEIGAKPAKKVTTNTAVGTYTASTSIASLGTRPANAGYILAVADSLYTDSVHSVAYVQIPFLKVTSEPLAVIGLGSKFDVTVTAVDAKGNPDTGFSGPVTLHGSSVNAVKGVANFPNLVVSTLGMYSLPVTSPGLPPINTTSFTIAYTPAEVRAAYGIGAIAPFNVGTKADGSGQTIAIIERYDDPSLVSSTDPDFSSSDLAKFDAVFGLPNPPSFLSSTSLEQPLLYQERI